MFCENCDREIDDNSRYCKYCGHENIDYEDEDRLLNDVSIAYKQPVKLSKTRIFLAYILGFLSLPIIYFLFIAIVATLLEILHLQFILNILSFLRKESPLYILILISALVGAFAQVKIVLSLTRKDEHKGYSILINLSKLWIFFSATDLLSSFIRGGTVFVSIAFILASSSVLLHSRDEKMKLEKPHYS